MKVIKGTFISTAGHGYYSISKSDIRLLNLQDKISGYSGHSFTRVYLEEDCDGTLLQKKINELGYILDCKSGYNEKFDITHNYDPAMFDFKPIVGQKVIIHGYEKPFTIETIAPKLIVKNCIGINFKLPTSNPFKYISGISE